VSDTGDYSDCSSAAVGSKTACIPFIPPEFLEILDSSTAQRMLAANPPRTPRTPRARRSSFGFEPLDPGSGAMAPDLWTDWRERMKEELERSEEASGDEGS
jgi:hypothetical protein